MSTAAFAWLGLLALLALWTLGAHNRITALRGAVLSGWAQAATALEARAKALAALQAAVAQPLAGESAALEATAVAQRQVQAATEAVRRRPLAGPAVAELGRADAALGAALVRLQALVEQHPALLADPAAAAPLQALRDSAARLAFARQVFNEAGAAYNRATTQFPTRLLRLVLRFGEAGRL